MGNSRYNPGWLIAVSVSKKGESSMKLLCCADLHNSFDLTHFETQTYDKEPDLIVTLGDISVQDLRIIKRTADNLVSRLSASVATMMNLSRCNQLVSMTYMAKLRRLMA